MERVSQRPQTDLLVAAGTRARKALGREQRRAVAHGQRTPPASTQLWAHGCRPGSLAVRVDLTVDLTVDLRLKDAIPRLRFGL